MRIFKILFLFTLISIGLVSCIKEINPQWTLEYFGPIVKTNIQIQDLLIEDALSYNENPNFNLVFNDTIFSLKLDSSVNSNDTINYKSFVLPISLDVAPGQMFLESDYKGYINANDLSLKMAITDTVIIEVSVKSSINEKVRVLFEIPNATKNGKSYSVFEDIDAAAIGDTIIRTKDIYLYGYTFDFSGENGNEYNVIKTRTSFWIHPDSDSTTLNKGDVVEVLTKLKSLNVKFVKGYLGSSSGNIAKKSKFKLFEKINGGQFKLDSIKAAIELHNNIGMDFRFKVNSLSAENSSSSVSINFDQSIIGQNINVARAGLMANNPITTIYKRNLNPNNIRDFMENQIDFINYDVDFSTNPMGNIGMFNDFLFKDNGADFLLNMEIPLNISFDNFIIIDTMKMEVDNIEEIIDAYLKVYINNRFPFDMKIYFEFLDENKLLIDSLNSNGIIATSAIVNADYSAIKAVETLSKIDISTEKKSELLNTKFIIIKAMVNNNDFQQKFRLNADDYMEVQIIGNLKLNIK